MCFHGGETCWSLREQREDCRSKICRLRSAAVDNTNDFQMRSLVYDGIDWGLFRSHECD